jgi:hypothetical protein
MTIPFENNSIPPKKLSWREQMLLLLKINIETYDEALGVISITSKLLYIGAVVAGIGGVAASWTIGTSEYGVNGIFNAILLALCAFLLGKYKSRSVASFAFAVGLLGMVFGGSLLAIAILIITGKALQAALRLRVLKSTPQTKIENVPSPVIIEEKMQPIILKSSLQEFQKATGKIFLIPHIALPFIVFLFVFFIDGDLGVKTFVYILAVVIGEVALYFGRRLTLSSTLSEFVVEVTDEGIKHKSPLIERVILFKDIKFVKVVQEKSGKIVAVSLTAQKAAFSMNITGIENMTPLLDAIAAHVDPTKITKKNTMTAPVYIFIVVAGCGVVFLAILGTLVQFLPSLTLSL